MSKDEVLHYISESLENLFSSGKIDMMDEAAIEDADLRRIVANINMLFSNITEAHGFVYELADGNLDATPPGRKNICASAFKQLQAQLSTLNWSLEQLLKGHIVGKIESEGILFQNFNKLVDRVANASTGGSKDFQYALNDEDEKQINSWRYHQIMLAVNMLDIKVIETDHDGKVVYSNKPGVKLLNGREYLSPGHVSDEDNEIIRHMGNIISNAGGFPVIKEIKDSDNIIWYRVTSDTFDLPTGQRFFLHVVNDITDWKKNEKRLERTANIDQMTGAMSRVAEMHFLKELSNEKDGSSHCLAFIDIDGLKKVNDIYGHNEGDDYIRIVSKIMLTSTRSSETVIRYGGDEFLVVFKDCSPELANKIMKRMEDNLDKLNRSGVKKYRMSFSYGVKQFGSGCALSLKEVLEQADHMMYSHKNSKRSGTGV